MTKFSNAPSVNSDPSLTQQSNINGENITNGTHRENFLTSTAGTTVELAKLSLADKNQGIYNAQQIESACKGFGTDEKKIMDTLKNLSATEMNALKVMYNLKYGAPLEQRLKGELNREELKEAMGYIDNPKVFKSHREHSGNSSSKAQHSKYSPRE